MNYFSLWLHFIFPILCRSMYDYFFPLLRMYFFFTKKYSIFNLVLQCSKLKEILSTYESTSRQKINTDKPSIFLSPNTSQELKDEIIQILGSMHDSNHMKYLGLPSIIGRSKKLVFAEIKDKLARSLWAGRVSYSQWGVRKFLSKQWPKPFPLTQWAASNFQRVSVKILKNWWEVFGGDKNIRKPKWPRLVGRQCASPSLKREWALGTCKPLILPYSQNNLGEFSQI